MERKSLIDECMESFKQEGFSFTRFGRLEGKKGMIFDLPFEDENSMLIYAYEINEDTMGVSVYDVIPYRFVDKAIREKIINTVNTKLNDEVLFYDERVCRFFAPFAVNRELASGSKIGAMVRQLACQLGTHILLCFK